MATYIKTLTDENNNEILPRTRISAITANNDVSLDTVLDSKINKSAQASKTSSMSNEVGVDANGKLWSNGGVWGTIAGEVSNQSDLTSNFLQSDNTTAGSPESINANTLDGYHANHFQTAFNAGQIAAIEAIAGGHVEIWTFTLADSTVITKKVLVLT